MAVSSKSKFFVYVFLFVAAVLLLTVFTGCDNRRVPPGAVFDYTVVFDDGSVQTSGSEVFNFGVAEPEGDSKTVTFIVTNNGETELTLSSAALSDDTNYTLVLPELPSTLGSGQTGAYSLIFSPAESGVFPSDISLTLAEIADPVTVQVTGEGNYPPVPQFGITVSGAGTAGANGFYVRDGFKTGSSNTRPQYTKSGTTTYYSYIYTWRQDVWCIADVPDVGGDNPNPLYDNTNDDPLGLVPPEIGWALVDGADDPPTVTVHDISGDSHETPVTLTAHYLYSDEEDDPEASGSAEYQWYRSDFGDPDGSYTVIPGETSNTYNTTSSDGGSHIKVGITLTAESGFTEGSEVLSSPTAQIVDLQD